MRYDGRGTGLSQRDVHDFSLDALLADLEAVVDGVEAERVTLMGIINSCPIAIAYAARHPERVSRLVLWCPVVDGSVHLGNPMLEAARRIIATDWVTFSETVAHGLVGWSETEDARRFAELVRAGITPETLLELVPALHRLDAWDLLPQVCCPTLLLHRPASPLLPPGTVERAAAALPDARVALFEGASSAPYVGDWRAITRAVAEFLGVPLSRANGNGNGNGRALRLLRMRDEALSPREQEIVALVVRGLTNREIASTLSLSGKTVENHISRILVKLDLRTRTQVATYALEHGLVIESI